MDRRKKLLMMDSRTFNRMTSPKDKVLTSVEGEMSSILKNESLPPDVRAKLYSSAQSRFLKIEHPQWGETSDKKPVKSSDSVLDTLPQNVVSKAKRLINTLKNNKRIDVTDRNEISIDGEVI